MSAILVCGGAGYIGSHAVKALVDAGREVLVLDDLSEGHRDAVHRAGVADAGFLQGSTTDAAFLDRVFSQHDIAAVMHFAARCYVGESVQDPLQYWRANVTGTLQLLEAMQAHGTHTLVFSSTCATYGEPDQMPIVESMPQRPINPYGATKLACERMFQDLAPLGFHSVALRYFNAAGADPSGTIGEDHTPETHLIPLVLDAVAGRRPPLQVFGDDYDTRDGTCIRDYVHVADLAAAHVLALDALLAGEIEGFDAFNLGSSNGTSVREVLDAAEKLTGRPVPHDIAPRRDGDPPVLVGSADKIRSRLGWQPRFEHIDAILETAHRWHENHPKGYDDADGNR